MKRTRTRTTGAERASAEASAKSPHGTRVLRALVLALPVALIACAADEPPPPQKPKLVQRDWVREIRAQAVRMESAVQVTPLADPAVEDLREQARSAEARGDADAARAALAQALSLRPEDPSLWQSQAEVSLLRGEWRAAETEAVRAYDLGPKVGELCVRSKLTMHAARTELRDPTRAAEAREQAVACQVPQPVRM